MRFIIFFWLICFSFPVQSDKLYRADNHGPISVMGEHVHKYNEIMVSYRFANMKMSGLMNGTKPISIRESMSAPNYSSEGSSRIYMNAPVKMSMDMHSLGFMVAPHNYITFMLMTMYFEKEMSQERMPMSGSSRFDVNSNGFGDLDISAMIKILSSETLENQLNLGITLPTGSIDKRDSTPASPNSRLGYTMQNGSGTFDPYLSINNIIKFTKFKVGKQLYFKSSFSQKNSKGYNYGEFLDVKIWFSYNWIKNLSSSFKINYKYRSKMSGSDNEMNPRMSPSMDSKNQGYQKVNVGLSLNFVNHRKVLKNNRLGLEIILPISQNLRGIQMSEDYKTIVGWQYSF